MLFLPIWFVGAPHLLEAGYGPWLFFGFLLFIVGSNVWGWWNAPSELQADSSFCEAVFGFNLPPEGWIGLVGALVLTGCLITVFLFAM